MKFLPGYLFGHAQLEAPAKQGDPVDDEFLFAQGPTRGLSKIAFPDWRPSFEAFAALPNVALLRHQAEALIGLFRALL